VLPTRQLSASAPVVASPPMVSAPRCRVPTDSLTIRVYAHATGEWRQAALDELAMLLAGTGPGHEQRAT
jgi:hypothetical protein